MRLQHRVAQSASRAEFGMLTMSGSFFLDCALSVNLGELLLEDVDHHALDVFCVDLVAVVGELFFFSESSDLLQKLGLL